MSASTGPAPADSYVQNFYKKGGRHYRELRLGGNAVKYTRSQDRAYLITVVRVIADSLTRTSEKRSQCVYPVSCTAAHLATRAAGIELVHKHIFVDLGSTNRKTPGCAYCAVARQRRK